MNSLNNNQDKTYPIRIILASWNPLIRESLIVHIEKQQDMEVIAETDDNEIAVSLATYLHPNVVIMDDIDMPKISGVEAIKQIIEKCPGTRILVLNCDDDIEQVKQAEVSYLSKRATLDLIFRVVRDTGTEQSRHPRQSIPGVIGSGLHNIKPKLTTKELTILKFVARGISNKEISVNLGLSIPNVKATLHSIFHKLDVSSRTQAVLLCLKAGVLSLYDLNYQQLYKKKY